VFFVDDRAHPGMHTKNVYVIEVKPYERQIPQSVFIKRFMSSQLFKALGIPKAAAAKLEAVAEADDAAEKHMVPYTDDEREVDIVVGETILEKIRWFFNPHPHLEQVSLHPNYSKKSLRRGGPKSAKRTKRRNH
jgi:hypothetical protein